MDLKWLAAGVFLITATLHARDKLAVVIIDMQPGYIYQIDPDFSSPNTTLPRAIRRLLKKQNKLITWANKNEVPILIFETDKKGATAIQLQPKLKNANFRVIKKIGDAGFIGFSAMPALKALKDWDVTTLIVTGINGGACVLSTAISACDHSYKILTSEDLVADMRSDPILYPDDQWYKREYFRCGIQVFEKLDELLDSVIAAP